MNIKRKLKESEENKQQHKLTVKNLMLNLLVTSTIYYIWTNRLTLTFLTFNVSLIIVHALYVIKYQYVIDKHYKKSIREGVDNYDNNTN